MAAILADELTRVGLAARLGGSEALMTGTPIILFGQGATEAPPLTEPQVRRAVVLLLAGPRTQAFRAAAGLAERAAGCFAVSPRTVARLTAEGIRTERFVLGPSDHWGTGGGADRRRPIDIVQIGELDGPGRRVLARIAPELAGMTSHVELAPPHPEGPTRPFESSKLLAGATLTLSLNRFGDTALDWPTVVRAMCSGSVVIAERATGYGELVPGEHFYMSRAERIGPVIRAALADPHATAAMAAAANQLCRTELAMSASVERLASVADQPRLRLGLRRKGARPPVTPSGTRTGLKRLEWVTVHPLHGVPDTQAEIDVICIEHPGSGPVSLTRDSLHAQQVHVKLHVGTLERGSASPPLTRSERIEASIAETRNSLVRHSTAPLILFIASGDEILSDSLDQMAAALLSSTQPDICIPIVALGSDDLADLPRENPSQSPAAANSLPRGYAVRRSYLDRVGPFAAGDGETPGVDRAFWRRAAAAGGRVAVLPRVGLRLWPQAPSE